METEIFNYLESKEQQVGAKIVRAACRRYMLKKTWAGVIPEKRKPIQRKWTMDAYAKQGGKCARCGQYVEVADATGDHTIPLAKGGRHNRHNIQMMHRSCNSAKGANDLVTESKKTGRIIREILDPNEL